MGEQNKPESTRGDEPGTKQQQGSPGQQPQKPMGQPDKTDPNADPQKNRDQGRKAGEEEPEGVEKPLRNP
jgi:hypothetical protein